MTTKQNKHIFSTDNFCLATFLKTNGCVLVNITKGQFHHATFEFNDTSERVRLTQDYWNGKSLIEPRTFYCNQRELKTLLYDSSYPAKT